MQGYDGDWAAEERPHGQRAKLSPSPFSPGAQTHGKPSRQRSWDQASSRTVLRKKTVKEADPQPSSSQTKPTPSPVSTDPEVTALAGVPCPGD